MTLRRVRFAVVALFVLGNAALSVAQGTNPPVLPPQAQPPRAPVGNAPAQPAYNPAQVPQQQPGAVLPGGQPAQPRQLAVAPPFQLTPQEQADLENMLRTWETKSAEVKTFMSDFVRLEYDPTFTNGDPNQPRSMGKGVLKYAAPDKGLYHVKEVTDYIFSPQTKKFEPTKAGEGEYWTCNGKTIYQIDRPTKKLIERPIPPELQGQSITEGPLPFVFGAKAESLKKRYFMRLITPASVAGDQIWLEARPRTQRGAAEFSRIELILSKNEMNPRAVQIYNPGAGNLARTVITFQEKPSVNNPWLPWQQLFRDFSEPPLPFGYTRVIEKPDVAPPPSGQPQQPGMAPGVAPGAVNPGISTRPTVPALPPR